MPTVSRISISPVKGLALVHPKEVLLEHTGVRENRRFHIVDAEGRRYNQLRNGELVRIRQEYDAERGWLALHFPDGFVADGLVSHDGEVTTDFYGVRSRAALSRAPGRTRSRAGPGGRCGSSNRRPALPSTAVAAMCR